MKNFLIIALLAFTGLCCAQNAKSALKTKISDKRIVVTSGRINDSDFDTLIKETLEKYKDRHGTQIIIKAPGHHTFNYKIPDIDTPATIIKTIAFKPINTSTLPNKKQNNSSEEFKLDFIQFHRPEPLHLNTEDSLKREKLTIKPEKLLLNP